MDHEHIRLKNIPLHGVKACVVKLVDFAQFMEAIRPLGVFWAVANEPPMPTGRASSP
jgi:hypothetical protein